jgi:type IV pilus assembly protein PilY1
MKIIALSILSISLNSWAAQTVDKPLSTLSVGDIKPNVMFIIDDSGSMASSHMPDDVVDWRTKVGYHNALCNGVYYNPEINYLAPKNANGTDMPNASFNAAWDDGFSRGSTQTYDLARNFFAYNSTTGGSNGPRERAFYWQFTKVGVPSASQCEKQLNNAGSDWRKEQIPLDSSAQ